MVMIEAMACGTPVIAFNRGSVSEVVKDGQSGFVVKTLDEMCEAVKIVDQIDRKACRQWFEDNFTAAKMADGYERVYEKVLNQSERMSELAKIQQKMEAILDKQEFLKQ